MVALFVIVTFVAFILADAGVQWAQERKREKAASVARRAAPALALEGAAIPLGLYAGPGHTWVGVDAGGRARVGIDALMLRLIGRIDAVELPGEGQRVAKGDALCTLRQGERRASFLSPVEGVVASVNDKLSGDPENLRNDPYGRGWICSIIPTSVARSVRQLFIAEEAREWIEGEVRRIREFFASRPMKDLALGEVMQDGGQPTWGVLESLDAETWGEFTGQFLGK